MSSESGYKLPSDLVLQNSAKLAIVHDKPVMYDYWTESCEKKALVGVRENEEKLLVKSEDEYTSPIQKIFKIAEAYIIMTENSLYLVSSDIPTKKIS